VVKRLEKLSSTAPYIVAIADLDHFKRLNDTYGHECGDRVLAAVGHRLRDSVRSVDTVGRWGGEEFIVVMEQSTLADATEVVERLRARIAEPVPCTGHSHSITVSVGLTDAQPDGTAARALQRADAALYEAKAAGRNAVHVVPGPPPAPGAPPPPRRRRS
jgi:diguanylate cyclase (GGDEF)-like protein